MVGRNAPIKVVIPAFRALRTIRECVQAILASGPQLDLEIVVVDDGENPGLEDTLLGLPVAIVRSGASGSAAIARNVGCEGFSDGILVFIDADVIVEPTCLPALIKPILDGDAAATIGNYSKDIAGLNFAAKYKQLYVSRIYDRRSGDLRNDYWTAVGAIDAAAFHALGGFDPQFKGACGEDGDLGLRLTAAGYRIAGVPEARARHRHPIGLRALFRNDWRKGLVALRAYERSGGALSENKHATARDVICVALSVAFIGALLATPIAGPTSAALGGSLYFAARADVIRVLLSGGIWFAVRAVWLMLALDHLRFACVAFCAFRRLPLPSTRVRLPRRARHA
jgi:GT2 family glycosyltransferase